jgi:hypothetical protein
MIVVVPRARQDHQPGIAAIVGALSMAEPPSLRRLTAARHMPLLLRLCGLKPVLLPVGCPSDPPPLAVRSIVDNSACL